MPTPEAMQLPVSKQTTLRVIDMEETLIKLSSSVALLRFTESGSPALYAVLPNIIIIKPNLDKLFQKMQVSWFSKREGQDRQQ